MNKHSQLIATCFVFACQLTASAIDPTVTSATVSWGNAAGGLNFSITGLSLSVQGQGSVVFPAPFVGVGMPVICPDIQCFEFGLQPTRGQLNLRCSVIGIVSGSCMGDGTVFTSIPSTVLMPSTPNPTFTFPSHLTANYELCGPGFPPLCPFPESPVAIIIVDLPGELTLSFAGPFPAQIPPGPLGPPFEFDVFEEAQFISTPIPESSNLILMLIGSVGLALVVTKRRRI
jgi:hypothetical protein